LAEHEMQALRRAVWRRRSWNLLGLAAGAGMGLILTRRTVPLLKRGLMVVVSSAFVGSLGSQFALVQSMRELTDAQKYPGITALIRVMLQSHGADPRLVDRVAASKIPRRPDAGLPAPQQPQQPQRQQQPGYEAAAVGARDAVYNDSPQVEFGNPALEQEVQQSQFEFGNPGLQPAADAAGGASPHSTWDYTRKSAPLQESAWDRLRRQSVLKEAGDAHTDRQQESPWDSLTRFEGFRDTDSSSASDDSSRLSDEPQRPAAGDSSRRSGGPSLAA
ncbi:hypothetical protein H4R21_004838, partial [Coemansia helicoidea]